MAKHATGISDTILQTKLHIPQARPVLVPRPRLIEQINRLQTPCFTLISAPAGFGKTTLLSEWVRQDQVTAAWISLDAGDNDPVRFLSHLAAALMTIDETVGDDALAAIQSPQPLSIDRILALLINDIAEFSGSVALVFDDYQFIEAQEVHQALNAVLDRLPSNMHLLLASRVDPPWPLARYRSLGTMNEIRANDLRFTHEETLAFLNETMDLSLSTDEAAKLSDRTEGWIAGLQMVAISLKDRRDRTRFIEAFSGSHRYILDYLMEEVLERQPQELRTFLLETSILERLCAPLCEAITGQAKAHSILDEIDHSNLFLVPLDDERRWYRYHQLFADLLRSHLKELQEGRLQELHQKASQWFEEQDLSNEAIHHALEGADHERSIQLIGDKALELVFQGGLRTLVRWLKQLPKDTVNATPRLCLAEAWAHVYRGNFRQCLLAIEACEKALDQSKPDQAESDLVKGQLKCVSAYHAWFMDDVKTAEQHAQQALALLPDSDANGRAWAAQVLGAMLRGQSQYDEAEKWFHYAIETSINAGAYYLAIDALWELSVLTFNTGRLSETLEICHRALDLANRFIRQGGQRLPVIGYIYSRMASVSRARGEFSRALEHALEGVRLSQRWGVHDALYMTHSILGGVYVSLGEFELAHQSIAKAIAVANDLSPMYLEQAQAREALLHLEQGTPTLAFDYLERNPLLLEDTPDPVWFHKHRIVALLAIERARALSDEIPPEVLPTLTLMEAMCDDVGANGVNLEVLLVLVLAFQVVGDDDAALERLKKALGLAQNEGFILPFIQHRDRILPYLRTLHRINGYDELINRILQHSAVDRKFTLSQHAAAVLVEPLSDRELEVLRYLSTRLSSNEIAAELYIATSTVRSHIKSIYGKLAVHSRREAVERAQDLGLL
jgi:LuxR family maltose regulon positive regulatory protein